MYDFFCPNHNASPNVIGVNPDFAISLIVRILLLIDLFPFLKSVGGTQYELILFFTALSKTILFNLCGHGHFDMTAYDDYFRGKLADDFYDETSANQSLTKLPEIV